MTNTEFAALSTGDWEYAHGSDINCRLMRWARLGNKVALLTVSYDHWAGGSSRLQQGIYSGRRSRTAAFAHSRRTSRHE
jgi:hypothetical protein